MSLIGLTVEDFAEQLAGDTPAPGGGSVAALAGALSASLCAMVARLTIGRKQYRDAEEAMERVREKCDQLAAKLLTLVDLDTDAYNQVTTAFKMPKASDVQKLARSEAIQEATKLAAAVPLETLKTVAELCDSVVEVLEKGNPNCVTDAGVAAQMIRASAAGAAYNVRVNLSGIKDQTLVNDLSGRTSELMKQITEAVARLEKTVEQKLG